MWIKKKNPLYCYRIDYRINYRIDEPMLPKSKEQNKTMPNKNLNVVTCIFFPFYLQ